MTQNAETEFYSQSSYVHYQRPLGTLVLDMNEQDHMHSALLLISLELNSV